MLKDRFSTIATLTNITEADLTSNRVGKLSDTQKEALQDNQRTGRILGIIFGLILAGFGIVLLMGQYPLDVKVNGVFSLVISAIVFYYTFKPRAISADTLPVQQVTGYLQKEAIDNEGISHFLIIDDVRFQVKQSIYQTLTEGAPYTFYYITSKNGKDAQAPRPISYEPATNMPPKTE